MRLSHAMKLLGLVLALSTAAPVVTVPFHARAVATAAPPQPRRTGDPDTPEWTGPSPHLRPASTAAEATAPTWGELLLRWFRGVSIAP
jgi:hypothetical protein